MSKCDPNAVLQRGPDNYQNTTAYPDTVASYSGGGGTADNVLENALCNATVYVGAAVRMSGSTVVNAQANAIANSRVIGIVIAKPTATTCDIQMCGVTTAVLAGLSIGSYYFLSDATAGLITTVVPTAASSVVINIGQPRSSTIFFVQLTTPIIRAA